MARHGTLAQHTSFLGCNWAFHIPAKKTNQIVHVISSAELGSFIWESASCTQDDLNPICTIIVRVML
jgi:hypothetical protein